MDPFDAGADETVQLAMTRHRATGERRGSLLLNPGGPGGAGVPFAWGIRSAFPVEVLRSFDIVSWDPRGVGHSLPAISCGDGSDTDIDGDFVMEQCSEASGALAAHLAAPYSAADMDAIRVALGESQLDYLGYSYGATLGAAYAALFPESVGRFVLDGVTDPLIGSEEGHFEQGFPYYAEDGIPLATERFEELCNATERCDLGDDTARALDDIGADVSGLPTDDFAGEPERVNEDDFAELFVSSLTYSGDWELLATGLADADNDDGSALAALVSTDLATSSEAGDETTPPFELANIVIYCADFRHVITEWVYCEGLTKNERTLLPVEPVEVDTPVLVIGTDFDPLTPGKHAPDFAAALGDAVVISWSGVGHTAFPAPTSCINNAVVRYLIDGVVPTNGLACPFLDGAGAEPSDQQLGDILFGHGDAESERLLTDVFELDFGFEADAARCAARNVNQLADQTISHVALAVSSDAAEEAISSAQRDC